MAYLRTDRTANNIDSERQTVRNSRTRLVTYLSLVPLPFKLSGAVVYLHDLFGRIGRSAL